MKAKITKLTPEQQTKLAEWRDKWTTIGLSTEPANRPEAERAIRMAYEAAGKAAPRIVWCTSPLAQGLTRAIIQKLPDSVGASVWASVGASGYGQHDANWLAFYDYFREVCSLRDETRLLEGLTLLAQHAGWFLPHENICWVSERHSILHRDDEGRLHCETGPALGYPDKFSIWAWHGVRVSQQVIEAPETLTVEQIQNEQNAEIRRVMLERFGAERFVREAGGTVVHEADLHGKFPQYLNLGDKREFIGFADSSEHIRLIRTKLLRADDKPLTYVHVCCPSTAREYYLRVNPEHTNAIDAVASTFNMSGDEYKSFVQGHTARRKEK